MKRKIIKIDENKCNGCGLCVPDCPEGALQIIDGKARLVSDLFCDGLGACIGNCPEGAISIEEREAAPYDETLVMENIVKNGDNTIKAHLEHLKTHNADEYYNEALEYLKNNKYDIEKYAVKEEKSVFSCPGTMSRTLKPAQHGAAGSAHSSRHSHPGPAENRSELGNWPIQLHLINPLSPHFRNSDLLVAADCTAFSLAGFHDRYLKGRQLVIACPKLDNSAEIYKAKLADLMDNSQINTVTVIIMQVPCCTGLALIVKEAAASAERKVPVKEIIVSIEGEILKEQWV